MQQTSNEFTHSRAQGIERDPGLRRVLIGMVAEEGISPEEINTWTAEKLDAAVSAIECRGAHLAAREVRLRLAGTLGDFIDRLWPLRPGDPALREYTFSTAIGQGVLSEDGPAIAQFWHDISLAFAQKVPRAVVELAFQRKKAVVRCTRTLNPDELAALSRCFWTFNWSTRGSREFPRDTSAVTYQQQRERLEVFLVAQGETADTAKALSDDALGERVDDILGRLWAAAVDRREAARKLEQEANAGARGGAPVVPGMDPVKEPVVFNDLIVTGDLMNPQVARGFVKLEPGETYTPGLLDPPVPDGHRYETNEDLRRRLGQDAPLRSPTAAEVRAAPFEDMPKAETPVSDPLIPPSE